MWVAVLGALQGCWGDSEINLMPLEVPGRKRKRVCDNRHTCPVSERACQGPAGGWGARAAAAGGGPLPGLLLPAPSPSPAPEAAGSRTAGPPEQGPHLEKGQEALRTYPPLEERVEGILSSPDFAFVQ